MKNRFSKKIFLTILGGAFLCIAAMTSCDNFLKGGEIKKEIQDTIAYNNAKEIEVLIQSKANEGTTVPSGNYTAKKGYEFEISFTEVQGYSFIEWIAVDKNDEADNPEEITKGVTFQDKTSPKTKVKITNDKTAIKIIPKCTDRISVSGDPSPRYESLGVSRDRSIIVEFTKELNPASFIFTAEEIPQNAEQKTDAAGNIWAYTLDKQTYLKNISITNVDGYSIAQHFKQPSVDGKYLKVEVDKTKPIAFEVGVTLKTIVVTLDQAITDKDGVCMSAAKSWRYQITESTDDQATINFVSTPAQGTINAISKSYSIGQTIALSFTENADYQFVKWDYNGAIVSVADATNSDTTVLVLEKTTETNPTQIKAICAERLRVTDFSPKTENAGSTVSKNTSITITFNKELPDTDADKEQLKNILISIGGTSVKSSFKNPVINANTITFAADNSNMIEVFAGQTKTVSVSIPADFYYINDGTKVTYGANGYSYDYKIDSSTSQKTDITFTASKQGAGMFTAASGTNEYSIGQEIPIAFEPTAGWKFTGWTITSAGNPVPQDKIRIEDSDSTSTKITILQEVKGVTITANAYFVPVIDSIKINGTTDYWRQSSFPCDSVLYITFNKPIDTGTVDYSRYGTFTITRTENNNTHCEDYFEMNWNDDNTMLILKPTPDIKSNLVPDENDTYNFLLTFNANGEFITDDDGQILEAGSQTYNSLVINYTITGKQEEIPPEIYALSVYSTSDTTDYFYKSLTNKPYLNSDGDLNWSDKTVNENKKLKYYNGDFSRNHVSHLYFNIWCYDFESGIGKVRIKETYKKFTDNVEILSSTPTYRDFDIEDLEPDIDEDGYVFCELEYDFDTRNTNDGLYLIEVSVLDRANNESGIAEYWVIKDTVSDPRISCFGPTQVSNAIVFPTLNPNNNNYELDYSFIGMTGTATGKTYKIAVRNGDIYYNGYDSVRNINVVLQEEGSAPVTIIKDFYNLGSNAATLGQSINNALKNYKRNVYKDTKITIIVEEESGNITEFPIVFLKSVDVLGFLDSGTAIRSNSETTYEDEDITYYTVYTYQETEDSTPGDYRVYQGIFSNPSVNGIYTVYIIRKCGEVFSTMGKPMKYYKGVQNVPAPPPITYPQVKQPDYGKGEIIYAQNSGTAKFKIKLTYPENVTQDYSYNLLLKDTLARTYYITNPKAPEESSVEIPIEVPSDEWYAIYLMALDSNNNIIATSNRIGDFLCLDDVDNIPPYVSSNFPINHNYHYESFIESHAFRSQSMLRDYNAQNDYMPKIYYYFTPPKFVGTLKQLEEYPQRELIVTQKDIANGYVDFPYDDLEYGNYNCYVLVYDEAGNYTLCKNGGSVKHYTAESIPKLTKQASGIKITFDQLSAEMCKGFIYTEDKGSKSTVTIRVLQNGGWVDTELRKDMTRYPAVPEATDENPNPEIPPIEAWNYEISYSNYKDTFIKVCGVYLNSDNSPTNLMPVYAYTGYYEYLANWAADDESHPGVPAPDYCQSKAWMPMANGWQLFVDRPCFVHTMYSSKLLNGVSEWESHGQETGLVYNDGAATTFSYTDDRLDGVPEGAYYITICHFADGSTVTSDVKQKEE